MFFKLLETHSNVPGTNGCLSLYFNHNGGEGERHECSSASLFVQNKESTLVLKTKCKFICNGIQRKEIV